MNQVTSQLVGATPTRIVVPHSIVFVSPSGDEVPLDGELLTSSSAVWCERLAISTTQTKKPPVSYEQASMSDILAFKHLLTAASWSAVDSTL